MKKKGIRRGFHQLSKAWYGENNLKMLKNLSDIISIAVYEEGDIFIGELSIEWTSVGKKFSPCLKVFDDSWRALSYCKDLIDTLKKYDRKDISSDQMREILLSLNMEDETETKKRENHD